MSREEMSREECLRIGIPIVISTSRIGTLAEIGAGLEREGSSKVESIIDKIEKDRAMLLNDVSLFSTKLCNDYMSERARRSWSEGVRLLKECERGEWPCYSVASTSIENAIYDMATSYEQ